MSDGAAEDRSSPGRLSRLDLVIAMLGVVAVVIAAFGWVEALAPRRWDDWVDVAVRSIKALLLSDIYFDPGQGLAVNGRLEAARTLGLMFSLLAAGRVVLFALRRQIARFRLARRQGHDVVIGGGPSAMAYAGAVAGRPTTHLVDGADAAHAVHATLERRGDLAFQLKAAAAQAARRIVVDEGEDSATWETAQAAARACPAIDVLAHIADPWLLERLDRADPESGLRAFSYAGGAARQVMLAHPPYLLARRLGAPAQHILLVGFGALGQALARDFLTTSVAAAPRDMMVTVIDPDIERLQAEFRARHPGLEAHVDFVWLRGDIARIDATLAAEIRARSDKAEICAVYVAIDDAHLPLSTGAALREMAGQMDLFRAPIFLCAVTGAGLPTVRQGAGLLSAKSPTGLERDDLQARAMREGMLCELRLVTFGSWAAALDGAGLMEAELDGQARRFHDSYRGLILGLDPAAATRPTIRPWASLPDEYRVSNRRVASHIRAKLDAVGFDLDAWLARAPGGRASQLLPEAADALAELDATEMDRLAELEHRRWMMDRLLNGWRFGASRDDVRKLHPDLKPNDELDEAAREKDRGNIRETARILAELMKAP